MKLNNVNIIHHNTHSLLNKSDFIAAYPAHIVTLSETDLPEHARKETERNLREHDKDILWSDQVAFGDNIEKNGRRAAIVSSNPIPLQYGQIDAEDIVTSILKASGRWEEAVVPVGDGSNSIMVATLYGISGANQSQQKYNNNETLIAAALVRMLSFGSTP